MAEKTIDDILKHTEDCWDPEMRKQLRAETKQALLAAIDEALPRLNDLPDYKENHPDKWEGFRDGVVATQRNIHKLFGEEGN